MRNYPEVPDWWYGVTFGTFLAVAVIATEVWDTGVPVYALVLSVLLPVVYVLPSGFIYAMTGQGVKFSFFFLFQENEFNDHGSELRLRSTSWRKSSQELYCQASHSRT
jgi:hypothetical protein